LLVDFENHHCNQLHEVVERTIYGKWLMRWTNVRRCSVKATATFDPVLHAVTLELGTPWRTSATIEHAPAQLFVESGNIRVQPSVGVA